MRDIWMIEASGSGKWLTYHFHRDTSLSVNTGCVQR